VHGVSAHGIVVYACSIDEFVVELQGKQWVGKFAEELLQQAGNTIDIMLEGFRVSKVHLRCICITSAPTFTVASRSLTTVEEILHLLDVRRGSGNAVNTLNLQPEEIYSLDALVHNHWHW
jgi:hypothetical protein